NGASHAERDAFHMLFVGSWRDRRKGLPVLLEAQQRLHARGLPVKLDVIGEGKPDADQLRIPGVTFVGTVGPESELADRYRNCDLFVAPSSGQESFGIVLIGAMAAARPIVCSNIRGYRDVVDPEGAVLVTPGDADGFAAAIESLMRDPARRHAMSAR